MTTVRDGAFDVVKEMLSEKDDIIASQDEYIDEVEEELELALEENAALRLEITRLMSDRSIAV
jgi:regulator of replication initiation timing